MRILEYRNLRDTEEEEEEEEEKEEEQEEQEEDEEQEEQEEWECGQINGKWRHTIPDSPIRFNTQIDAVTGVWSLGGA
nr:unnamed protein product [Spirometra erinaceieuropaei]